jgi:hypothetical protein
VKSLLSSVESSLIHVPWTVSTPHWTRTFTFPVTTSIGKGILGQTYLTELNDQILLNRHLRGADDVFRQLLERHSGLVYGTALRVTGDAGAAEEVSQDVFVLLAKKARSLGSHPRVAGWLHRTSHKVARHL